MMKKTIIVQKLDTGYLITLNEDETRVSDHALTSPDGMVAKIRELFDIGAKSAQHKKTPKITDTTLPKIKYGILGELPGKWPIKKEEFLVPDPVPLPNNQKVTFLETHDKRLNLKYRSANVYTTWDEIYHLLGKWKIPNDELIGILPDTPSNSKTAIRQFMIAVRDWNVKPGSSMDLDPDKDFRKQLNRSSMPEYERGTLEEVIT